MLSARNRRGTPLTEKMQPLWYRMHELSPSDPGKSFYGGVQGWLITGHLSRNLARTAIQQVCAELDVLRLEFLTTDLESGFRAAQCVEASFDFQDLANMGNRRSTAAIRDAVQAERYRYYDMQRAPLWNMRIFRLSEKRHIMLLGFSHILFDGWSGDLILKRWLSYLSGKSPSRPSPEARTGTSWLEDSSGYPVSPRLPFVSFPVRSNTSSLPLMADEQIVVSIPTPSRATARSRASQLKVSPFALHSAAWTRSIQTVLGVGEFVLSSTMLGRRGPTQMTTVGQCTQDVYALVPDAEASLLQVASAIADGFAESAKHAVPFKKHADILRPEKFSGVFSDLHFYDHYIQLDSPAPQSIQVGLLAAQRFEVDQLGTVHDSLEYKVSSLATSCLDAWAKHSMPNCVVSSDYTSASIYFNSSFFDRSLVEALGSTYLELLTES